MTLEEILAKLKTFSPEEIKLVQAKLDGLDALELRRRQVASGEGAVIPGDEILLQQSQSQQ
jgi:hypothetical protein